MVLKVRIIALCCRWTGVVTVAGRGIHRLAVIYDLAEPCLFFHGLNVGFRRNCELILGIVQEGVSRLLGFVGFLRSKSDVDGFLFILSRTLEMKLYGF
jgi:hypothetical protein